MKKLTEFEKGEMDFHNRHAEQYDSAHDLDSTRIALLHEKFLKHIYGLPKKSRVLEVGCGSGHDSVKIAKKGFQVIGCDISEGLIGVAKRKAKENKVEKNTRFFVASTNRLPFRGNSIDAALIVASLHHLENPVVALKEINRCLKPGGILVIGSEPNAWPYVFKKFKHSGLGKKIMGFFRKDYNAEEVSIGDEATTGFREKELRKMFEDSNFRVKRLDFEYFFSGFLILLKLNLGEPADKGVVWFDSVLSSLPGIRKFGWYINAVLEK